MKKFMLIAIIGLGFILTGCGSPTSSENVSDKNDIWMSHGNCTSTKVVNIEGHKYIIMVGFKAGTIIHAESCSCRK